MMAPPPKLPNYWRAPHQKPLKRAEKAAVSQRRQEPDREVITHMNDADPGFLPPELHNLKKEQPGFLPPDLHNYILDGQPMHLPGTSFTDFDGASSRKFLNKKTTQKEKGGWATVKSLPLIPQARSEMVSLSQFCKTLTFHLDFHSCLPGQRSLLTIPNPPHTILLSLLRFCKKDMLLSLIFSTPQEMTDSERLLGEVKLARTSYQINEIFTR